MLFLNTLDKTQNKDNSQSCPGSDKTKNSVRTEQNARSYKGIEKTSNDLSKDKSHASNEIEKNMINIWNDFVVVRNEEEIC
jgi:hypothetical protein